MSPAIMYTETILGNIAHTKKNTKQKEKAQ